MKARRRPAAAAAPHHPQKPEDADARSTAAKLKFQSNLWVLLDVEEKERGIVRLPQLEIGWPPAARSEVEAEAEDRCGTTLIIASVSTRNSRRDNVSRM